jgi:hypothetical protein
MSPGAGPQLSTFVPVGWRSQDVLEVKESVFGTDVCAEPSKELRHRLDLRTLHFAPALGVQQTLKFVGPRQSVITQA